MGCHEWWYIFGHEWGDLPMITAKLPHKWQKNLYSQQPYIISSYKLLLGLEHARTWSRIKNVMKTGKLWKLPIAYCNAMQLHIVY